MVRPSSLENDKIRFQRFLPLFLKNQWIWCSLPVWFSLLLQSPLMKMRSNWPLSGRRGTAGRMSIKWPQRFSFALMPKTPRQFPTRFSSDWGVFPAKKWPKTGFSLFGPAGFEHRNATGRTPWIVWLNSSKKHPSHRKHASSPNRPKLRKNAYWRQNGVEVNANGQDDGFRYLRIIKNPSVPELPLTKQKNQKIYWQKNTCYI